MAALLLLSSCVGAVGGSVDAAASDGPGLPPTTISSCREITAPGYYVVASDLSSSNGACLNIHDTSEVTVDCTGHTVSGSAALLVTNVDQFTITHCTFTPGYSPAVLNHASNGTLRYNTFGPMVVSGQQVTSLHFDQNTFNSGYQQYYSTGVVFSNNTMVNPIRGANYASALFISAQGSNNQFVNNTIDGKWDGVRLPTFHYTEIDDGIVVSDEHGDTISGNTISNVFECGFESTGVVTASTISNNQIHNAGMCGFGAWFWNNFYANTVSGNTVDGSRELFQFNREHGLRPAGFDNLHLLPADPGVYFKDNVFDGNKLTNPYNDLAGQPATGIYVFINMGFAGGVSPGETVPASSDFVLTNNLFRNNDFGKVLGAPAFGMPFLSGRIIDGGGNICNNNGGAGYPINCH